MTQQIFCRVISYQESTNWSNCGNEQLLHSCGWNLSTRGICLVKVSWKLPLVCFWMNINNCCS